MQLKVLGLQGATSIELVTAATAKMTAAETAAALATTGLNAEKQIQILKDKISDLIMLLIKDTPIPEWYGKI